MIPSNGIQDLVIYGFIFLLGLVVKSKIQWGKTNSDVLETISKDYQTLKILYNSTCDDVKKRDEQIALLRDDVLQAKARITSYENFLQARTLETDSLLKRVPGVLEAVAKHFDLPIEDGGIRGHESAHSQVK